MKLIVGSMLVCGAFFDVLLNHGAICAALLARVAGFAHGIANAFGHWLPIMN